MVIQLNRQLIEALRSVIVLPEHITSLDLSMRMDDVPKITLTTFVVGHRRIIERIDTFTLVADDWLQQRTNDAHAQVASWFDDIRKKLD